MSDKKAVSQFIKEFCQRIRALRIENGMSQEEVARILDIKADTYAKYERRSPLPHFLIPKVAGIFRTDCHFLLTGKHFRNPVKKTPRPEKRQVA